MVHFTLSRFYTAYGVVSDLMGVLGFSLQTENYLWLVSGIQNLFWGLLMWDFKGYLHKLSHLIINLMQHRFFIPHNPYFVTLLTKFLRYYAEITEIL